MSVRHLVLAFAGLLTAAAPPPQTDTIRQLAECRLDPDKALPAFELLSVSNQHEADDPPRKRIIRAYDMPAGLTIYGAAPVEMGSLETLETGQDRIMIITTMNGGPAPFEAAALAANGETACANQDDPNRKICNVTIRRTPSGRVTLIVAQKGEMTDIACSYQRS